MPLPRGLTESTRPTLVEAWAAPMPGSEGTEKLTFFIQPRTMRLGAMSCGLLGEAGVAVDCGFSADAGTARSR